MSDCKNGSEKINTVFELFEFAEQCIKSKVLRKNPSATPAEIADALRQWYQTRPGAEHGDFSGKYIIKKSSDYGI